MSNEVAMVIYGVPGEPGYTFDLKKFPIKDTALFGSKQGDDTEFRWPTQADLEKLNLSKPPKLTQIITSGSSDGYLARIQLKFEGGIDSPLIDSQHGSLKN